MNGLNQAGWDPVSYRERLRQRLYGQTAPPQEGQPIAMDQLPSHQAQGGAFGQQPAPATPPPSAAPVQSPGPAMQAAPQERKKLPIYPGGVKPEYDEKDVKKIKTPADIISKMKNADAFMNAWEQERGAIDDHYTAMLQNLGQRPDKNKKLSKQDKFGMLMEFGLNLIKSSQRGSGNSLVGGVAQAAGETFANQRNREMAAPEMYDAKRAQIEGGRRAELRQLGGPSAALKGAFAIDRDEAAAERDRGYADEVVGTEDLTSGVTGRTRGGALKPMTDPNTGQPAQRDEKSSSRSQTAYEVEHGYLTRRFRRQRQMSQAEAEDAATEEMRRRGGGQRKSLRRMASDDAKTILSGTDDWKYAKPEERDKMRTEYMAEERRQAILDAYNIDVNDKRYRSLGAMVGKKNDKRASPDAEADLKENPDLAPDFYEEYGYLPDDFWPE